MNDLSYDLAKIYAKVKFEEYCRRLKDEQLFGDSHVLLESLDDFFEEAYKHYSGIEKFDSFLKD